MNIRFANSDDQQSVLELINELRADWSGSLIKDISKQYDKMMNNSDYKIFLIENNSQIVGLATFYSIPKLSGQRGLVEDFVITEKERGHGYGTALLNNIKEYCKVNEIRVLNITSGFEHEKAHRFYEKNGGVFKGKKFKFYF